VLKAPFNSGTDESISYVAFVAAKNRWATEEDFHRYGIDHYYYPPLYYLVFAPFWGDDPAFVEDYPRGGSNDPNYLNFVGRRVTATGFSARVPRSVERLYRAAKISSLGLCGAPLLVRTLRLLFPGRPVDRARRSTARVPPAVPLLSFTRQRHPAQRFGALACPSSPRFALGGGRPFC
jgi:hypothetical protein